MIPRSLQSLLAFGALVIPSLLVAQNDGPPSDPRLEDIKARHARHEPISIEDEDYFESATELRNQTESARRNVDWAREHPARDTTGLMPLPQLGKDTYQGQQGGLYPNGENTPPPEHLHAGLALAQQIVPLDAEGRRSPDGKIVFLTIGMSNTQQESRSFLMLAASHRDEYNPKLVLVDGAEGAKTANITAQPHNPYWEIPAHRLQEAGVTPMQVQAVWLKQANPMPKAEFPIEVRTLEADVLATIHNLHDKFPNLKITYLSSRIYAGYAVSPLNPEPHAYESGFACKWLIADQIAGQPELNFDPTKGAVRAPWLAWGPYLWADGLKPRPDGLIWKREDLSPDGTHPSVKGREKVAALLFAFLKQEPTAESWFGKQ